MNPPILWIVAGPNGAGKTTSVQRAPIAQIIPQVSFLNPDDRTLEKLRIAGFGGFADAPFDILTRLFLESADEVDIALIESIERGANVGVETVLSTDKYKKHVERVHSLQGSFFFIYVALSSPDLARQRVASRVAKGGHGVPEPKIHSRWWKSLEKLTWFAERAAGYWIVDNSDSNPDNPLLLLAAGRDGKLLTDNKPAFPEMQAVLDQLPPLVLV